MSIEKGFEEIDKVFEGSLKEAWEYLVGPVVDPESDEVEETLDDAPFEDFGTSDEESDLSDESEEN